MSEKQIFPRHWIKPPKVAERRLPTCHTVTSSIHRREWNNSFNWRQNSFPIQNCASSWKPPTSCYSQHLADWINQLRSKIRVTIKNARNIHHSKPQSAAQNRQTSRASHCQIQPKPTRRPSQTVLIIRELSYERATLIKTPVALQNRRYTLTSPIIRTINAQTLATLTIQNMV